MDYVLAKVRGPRKKPFFKLLSDKSLFNSVIVNLPNCIPYNPDHNLDEDSWFKLEQFSQKKYCIDFLKNDFDSKDYDDLQKAQFNKISYIFSVQGDDFYFQKISPSLFIRRKTIVFGEVAEVEEGVNRLVINSQPDAVYFKASDSLIFRNLATISSIFEGIDELYKEATKAEVTQFLDEPFIELAGEYNADKVSKPNRKRISLAMATLATMSDEDKTGVHFYIENYCEQKLKFNKQDSKFEISTDDELKLLLYGIEQRFYTTPFGHEKRLANSVVSLA
ncbi:ATP F0F1 synthase synthase [Undibacterium sp. CY7W]|uniref:ATP F0F1 synthase synthase n=1 Tax=Undibacterium rugosum TaxID=2762291 RepID=A0A923L0E7_9BURK|nr:ATP F0F1 synthase synthase [Undibacterium rugosum]MBC3936741.1 ATP F0F1 synthase synthase [Undibacterium rugosum]